MIRRALTIAGSDSGGGAGIQADIKTFSAFGVYGMSALTALTAQNTVGVSAIHLVPERFVLAQIDAVAADIGVDATKTGMLASPQIVAAVAAAVRRWNLAPLIVDPVMVAESGARLTESDIGAALLRELVPLATLVTPNVYEAHRLTGLRIHSLAEAREAARRLIDRGAKAVLLKGGHLEGEDATDIFDDGHSVREFSARRQPASHTHGTGCQLSAAIAAGLATGLSLIEAIEQGKDFITTAIRHGLAIGRGHGPANPLAWCASHRQGTPIA